MDLNVRVVLNKPRSYLGNETDWQWKCWNVERGRHRVAITITQISGIRLTWSNQRLIWCCESDQVLRVFTSRTEYSLDLGWVSKQCLCKYWNIAHQSLRDNSLICFAWFCHIVRVIFFSPRFFLSTSLVLVKVLYANEKYRVVAAVFRTNPKHQRHVFHTRVLKIH